MANGLVQLQYRVTSTAVCSRPICCSSNGIYGYVYIQTNHMSVENLRLGLNNDIDSIGTIYAAVSVWDLDFYVRL